MKVDGTGKIYACYVDGGYSDKATVMSYQTITGVAPVENSGLLKIFPNPATDILNINLPGDLFGGQLTITDLPGKNVFKQAVPAGNIHISLGGLPAAVYLLKYKTREGKIYKEKLIVK